jgi:ABC-type transporter Mla maintaining outer membrane lipid asymmetry ATPase subunit MlaF
MFRPQPGSNLMVRLQRERNLTYVLISHDLSVVEHVSDTTLITAYRRALWTRNSSAILPIPLYPRFDRGDSGTRVRCASSRRSGAGRGAESHRPARRLFHLGSRRRD